MGNKDTEVLNALVTLELLDGRVLGVVVQLERGSWGLSSSCVCIALKHKTEKTSIA